MNSQSATEPAVQASLTTAQPAIAAHPAPKVAEVKTTTVDIFYPDSNCERLVPEAIEVPETKSLEAAIAKVLEKAANGDFDLAGYRVDEDKTNSTIAIDLRLSPESTRQFASMTSCEQFSVFGSLRQTIANNPQWRGEDVRFTQQGEDIFF